MLEIRPADPQNDEALLLQLWRGCLSSRWAVTPAWFRRVTVVSTSRPGDLLLAEQAGHAIGFALTQVGQGAEPGGSILALGVLPEFRRRGVGRALHTAALAQLRARGALNACLGSGAGQYFWPGVPLDGSAAWNFFQALGWQDQEHSFDLVRSLDDYHTPAWVGERVAGLDVDFVSAEGADAADVLAFIAAEETGWVGAYSAYLAGGKAADVLLARRRADGEIVAACLLEDAAQRWAGCFPGPLAAPGCFVTAERWQGQGIGMALVARACELLQARGCKTCFIGWTWLVDWYGKLGFAVWQENVMSCRVLS